MFSPRYWGGGSFEDKQLASATEPTYFTTKFRGREAATRSTPLPSSLLLHRHYPRPHPLWHRGPGSCLRRAFCAQGASPTREPGDFSAHPGRGGEKRSCDVRVPLWKRCVLKLNPVISTHLPNPLLPSPRRPGVLWVGASEPQLPGWEGQQVCSFRKNRTKIKIMIMISFIYTAPFTYYKVLYNKNNWQTKHYWQKQKSRMHSRLWWSVDHYQGPSEWFQATFQLMRSQHIGNVKQKPDPAEKRWLRWQRKRLSV